jgi:hypothetical protein
MIDVKVRVIPAGSTQPKRRLNAGSLPLTLAHTVSPNAKVVFGVVQSAA